MNKNIQLYGRLVALQAIWNVAPSEQRLLLEPFIKEEIRHIHAMRLIEQTDKVIKLIIVGVICLTTIHWLINL